MIKALKLIVLIIVMGTIGFACYNAGKSAIYNTQYEYFNRTEALLDSINNWDESFMDTVMETDVYYEYEVTRDKLIKN